MATTTVAGCYPCLGEGSPPNTRDELADATEDYGDIIRNVVRENVNAMLTGTSTHFIRARTFRHWAQVRLANMPGRPSLRISCDFKLELDFTASLDRGDVSADDGSLGSTSQQRDRRYEHAYGDCNQQNSGYRDPSPDEKPGLTLESVVELRRLKLNRMALTIMRSVSKKLFHSKQARRSVQDVLSGTDERGLQPVAVVRKLDSDDDDVTSSVVSTDSSSEVSDSSD